MGMVSDKYADIIILTSEDPKDEDPKTIINDIKEKMKKKIKLSAIFPTFLCQL